MLRRYAHMAVRPRLAAADIALASITMPCCCRNQSTSSTLPLLAANLSISCSDQAQPSLRRYCRAARCPPNAALAHVYLSNAHQPSALSHLRMLMLPPLAALWPSVAGFGHSGSDSQLCRMSKRPAVAAALTASSLSGMPSSRSTFEVSMSAYHPAIRCRLSFREPTASR
jgi:hypothetical protein